MAGVADLSAALFGNRYMVNVILAADRMSARGELITTRGIARDLGVIDSLVRPVVLRLVAAGILRSLARSGGPRSPQYYDLEDNAVATALVATCRNVG
jgi:DNA-binding transcriptional regulator PaaX